MTKQDKHSFELYLANCTDRQVYGVLEKEAGAGRDDYAELVRAELKRRVLAH